jgi:hypothetical protein
VLELQVDVIGQGPLATSDHHGYEEQVQLVDEAGCEGRGGECRPGDG